MKTLYNRYISEQNPYIPIGEGAPEGGQGADQKRTKSVTWADEKRTKSDASAVTHGSSGSERRSAGLLQGFFGNLGLEGGGLDGLLQRFHLDDLDSGDILLGLIILFLILEDGDNLDLIITLGLMILFSLGDS